MPLLSDIFLQSLFTILPTVRLCADLGVETVDESSEMSDCVAGKCPFDEREAGIDSLEGRLLSWNRTLGRFDRPLECATNTSCCVSECVRRLRRDRLLISL